MARSGLLLDLVRAGARGDRVLFRKRHHVMSLPESDVRTIVAARLQQWGKRVTSTGGGATTPIGNGPEQPADRAAAGH